MRIIKSCLLIFSLVFLIHTTLNAAEGMWPLYDLNKLPFDKLKTMGLTLTPDDIFTPDGKGLYRGIANLSGGTASFVSPQGLLVTNHHVAFGALQRSSTLGQNYMRDGFYAPTLQDEIPAIGYFAEVTTAVEDVTDKIIAGVHDNMDDLERYEVIDAATKKIIQEAEEGRDVHCRVASMFGGSQYILYTSIRIRDIRIVYAPPEAIGNYGGDIDNWMWPRHVGDFSFMRAYVAPDGGTAEFDSANVPYHPEVYFPISGAGVKEGDFTMMMGFPGKTDRYASSYEIDYLVNTLYPARLDNYDAIWEILETAAKADPETAIRLAGTMSGVGNYMKKSHGQMVGFRRSHILKKKRENERQLKALIAGDPKLQKEFGTLFPDLEALLAGERQYWQRDLYLGWMRYVCDYFSLAGTIYRRAVEREKPDMERDHGYQDRDEQFRRKRMADAQINLVPAVDKKLFIHFLDKILALPESQKVETFEKLFPPTEGKTRHEMVVAFADRVYAETAIGNKDDRLAMLDMDREELEALHDPFIDLAKALEPEMESMRERSRTFDGGMNRLNPKLFQLYAIWKKGNLYPDANGTMRFNYGKVEGYSPADAVTYDYMTTMTGVLEKETGKDPFIVPERLKEVYATGDFGPYIDAHSHDIPVNFVTTNSGTNGSSGSPVFNGKGELIGLDFDTVYEGTVADYIYVPAFCRAVIVDAKYMLYIIDKVYGLSTLYNELTIH